MKGCGKHSAVDIICERHLDGAVIRYNYSTEENNRRCGDEALWRSGFAF